MNAIRRPGSSGPPGRISSSRPNWPACRRGRALDLAAGEGRNTVWLAERGWRVTAVDFSRVGLDKGRKLSAARGVDEDRVTWILADLCDYQPEPGAYDLALIAYLQVGPKCGPRVLARAAAALAPGGTVFIVAHDLTNLSEGTGGPQDPEVLYTPEADHRRAARAARPAGRAGAPGRGAGGGPATAIDTLVHAVRET